MPTINGTSGGDNLVGTNDADTLNGFEGDDALDGSGGVDQLFGGPGNDSLRIISTPLAGEVFDGGDGSDSLYVSLQARPPGATSVSLTNVSLVSIERLFFGETIGLFSGTEQKIQVNWSQLASFFPELFGRLLGRDTFDILLGNAGTYAIPNFLKTSWGSTDTISLTATGTGDYTLSASGSPGSVGIEALTGAGGNDRLNGNSLVNLLSGGSGNDMLTGGAGADHLTGGSGSDTFIDTREGLDGDVVADFTVGDRIILTDADFASFTFTLVDNTLTYSGGTLTFGTGLNGSLKASPAVGGGVQLAIEPSTVNDVHNDFNGDGRSDVLWRNIGGVLSNWLADSDGGFTINDAQARLIVPLDWRVAGTGDFDGDGRADILWERGPFPSAGPGEALQISTWLATHTGKFTVNDANALVTIFSTNWSIAGTGDFNGDGRDDILWRSTDGTISNWLGTEAGGFVINDANALVHVPNDWKIAGTGDFDGDGNADILWRNDNGLVSNWLGTDSGGFFINDANALTTWSVGGNLVGIGDFDGDGRDDILSRSTTGELFFTPAGLDGWFDFHMTSGFVAKVSLDWNVASVGDYNGDGTDDILWRNDNGALSNWLGTEGDGYRFTINDANALIMVTTDWVVQPFVPHGDPGIGDWDY